MGYYGILMDMNGFDPPVMKHGKSHIRKKNWNVSSANG